MHYKGSALTTELMLMARVISSTAFSEYCAQFNQGRLCNCGVHCFRCYKSNGAKVEPDQVGVYQTVKRRVTVGDQVDTFLKKDRAIPFKLVYASPKILGRRAKTDQGSLVSTDVDRSWRLQFGIIHRLVTSDGSIDSIEFSDSEGRTSHLNQHSNSRWSSNESSTVWFDNDANTLHFEYGTTWKFESTSAPDEPDSGDLYPTAIEDAIGNTLTMRYESGMNRSEPNTSGRLAEVSDIRGSFYSFSYSAATSYEAPHLSRMVNNLTGDSFTFEYANPSSQQVGGQSEHQGNSAVLQAIRNTKTGGALSFRYDASGSGELTEVSAEERSTDLQYELGGRLICAYSIDDDEGTTVSTLEGCELTGLPPDTASLTYNGPAQTDFRLRWEYYNRQFEGRLRGLLGILSPGCQAAFAKANIDPQAVADFAGDLRFWDTRGQVVDQLTVSDLLGPQAIDAALYLRGANKQYGMQPPATTLDNAGYVPSNT